LSLFKELKRRNVLKVAIAYVVSGWIILQLNDVFIDYFAMPEWAPRLILLFLVIGFVPAMILTWAFELTPDGIKLDKDVLREKSITPRTGHKLDIAIIVSIGLSLGLFIWQSRFDQKTAEYESAVAAGSTQTAVDAETNAEPPPARIDYSFEGIDKNSIAVLPFANRSADIEDVYFTDGIHEDLLTQLSRIDAFSIISRSSVMEYRDTTKNLREIAHELSVANVLEGSIQRAGDRVRINVQLIDAQTDEHLWAEIYDRELTTGNLFDIQSEIAKSIASALKATLTDSELASVGDVPTENVEAYDLYLKARQFAQNETLDDYQNAIALLKESVALDPSFKFAWIGLARAHMTNYWVYGGDPADIELALEAIERARSIDADFAELYMAEGFYWYWGHLDYERALYNLGKAIEMMPSNDDAYMWRGWVSRRAGLWEQARESMKQALKLNPRVHFNWHEYALTLMYLHRYEEATNAAMQARALDPESYWGRITLAKIVLQESGDLKTATELSSGTENSDDFNFFEVYMQVSILARRYDEALEAARGISDELEIQRNQIILREDWAARILYFMGRKEEAKQAASAALFRLNGLRSRLGDDYRIDLAEASVRTIQGASADEVRSMLQKSMASRPIDDVEASRFKLEYARIFSIAGMASEAVEMLEPILMPPSDTSIFELELDPAFDGIRDDPEFVAMMERQLQ